MSQARLFCEHVTPEGSTRSMMPRPWRPACRSVAIIRSILPAAGWHAVRRDHRSAQIHAKLGGDFARDVRSNLRSRRGSETDGLCPASATTISRAADLSGLRGGGRELTARPMAVTPPGATVCADVLRGEWLEESLAKMQCRAAPSVSKPLPCWPARLQPPAGSPNRCRSRRSAHPS